MLTSVQTTTELRQNYSVYCHHS